MPTGYTYDVAEGKVTDLKTFAFRCARNFGALITMRDMSMDAPIPDEFKPDDYYSKRCMELADRLGIIEAMSSEAATVACLAERNEAKTKSNRYIKEKQERKSLYLSMLNKVKNWAVPSDDHQGLKQFMISQLNESIDFDCGNYVPEVPELKSGLEWKTEKIASLKKNLAYAIKDRDAEFQRCKERTAWVKLLRELLE